MEHTAIDRVRALLEGVLKNADDKTDQFRLRTALQLLEFIEEQHDAANEALAESELDEQTRNNLRKLGYLD